MTISFQSLDLTNSDHDEPTRFTEAAGGIDTQSASTTALKFGLLLRAVTISGFLITGLIAHMLGL